MWPCARGIHDHETRNPCNHPHNHTGAGHERVLAGDFLAAIQTNNTAALEKALRSLARVVLT